MNKKYFFITVFILFAIGCGIVTPTPQPSPTPELFPTWTFSPLPTPTFPVTVFPSFTPTETFTASPSPTILPSDTLTPTPELRWTFRERGEHLIPILLYHQIGYSYIDGNEYYVSPEEFEKQISLLHQWGYETISVQLLALAITQGAELPPKPIIITFDDGNDNTYSTAFPILQKYNFTGTTYIVYNYIGTARYMDKKQIRELYDAGWEIGSHSLSHIDLTQNEKRIEKEIVDSRRKLQDLLGLPISSFAYPFGAYNAKALQYLSLAGYNAAVGLGADMHQGPKNLNYLYRQEIRGSYDLKTFAELLPWQGDPAFLLTTTLIP